jgi:hypothetical protein
MVVLLIVGLVLLTVGMIEGWRGNCGLATDACSVMGGFSIGIAVVSLVMS